MVEVWLPYGKTEVCVRIPTTTLQAIIEPKEKPAAKNPQDEIRNALTNPVGAKGLAESVKPGASVSLVLQDSDASTNRLIISAILDELSSTGIKDDRINLLLASNPFHVLSNNMGAHFADESEARLSFLIHNPDLSEMVKIGKTSRGTSVSVNRVFAEADIKILAGLVEPHPFAGYSGGRAGVLPGISAIETVRASMSLGLDEKPRHRELKDNPIHQDMVEAAHLCNVDFTLNILRNRRLEIVKAFAGGLDEAFNNAVDFADKNYRVLVDDRVDILFLSPGGYPYDASLYRSCAAIDNGLEAAKRGKPVVLVAECLDGHGSREFFRAMSKFEDSRTLRKSLKKQFTVGGFMAYRLRLSLQKAKIILVSAMPDYYVSKVFRMKSARTANEAYRQALEDIGKNGKVSFIPYGNVTIPFS